MKGGDQTEDQREWSLVYNDSDLDDLANAAQTKYLRFEQIRPKLEEFRLRLDGAAWHYQKDKEYAIKITPARLKYMFGRLENYTNMILEILNEREVSSALEAFREKEEGDKGEEVEAVREDLERLARWCSTAKVSADEFRALTTERGHRGDKALLDWVNSILTVYTLVTGSRPSASSRLQGPDHNGIAYSPTIKFLIVAAKGIDHEATENEWVSKVKTVKKGKLE